MTKQAWQPRIEGMTNLWVFPLALGLWSPSMASHLRSNRLASGCLLMEKRVKVLSASSSRVTGKRPHLWVFPLGPRRRAMAEALRETATDTPLESFLHCQTFSVTND